MLLCLARYLLNAKVIAVGPILILNIMEADGRHCNLFSFILARLIALRRAIALIGFRVESKLEGVVIPLAGTHIIVCLKGV